MGITVFIPGTAVPVPDDTYNGNVYIVDTQLRGYFWK
jgi:hypothetical protein